LLHFNGNNPNIPLPSSFFIFLANCIYIFSLYSHYIYIYISPCVCAGVNKEHYWICMQGGVGDINIEGRGGVILDKNINYRKMWRLKITEKGSNPYIFTTNDFFYQKPLWGTYELHVSIINNNNNIFFNHRNYMMSFFFLTIYIFIVAYDQKKKKVLGDSETALYKSRRIHFFPSWSLAWLVDSVQG